MSKKVLIVDDDPTLIKLLETLLSAHGYTVLTAFDGEEGLTKVASGRPDLIVLDVQMPRMNGYTFLFEMKKIEGTKSIPIIVLTAKEGMAEIFKIEGVKEYLPKPVAPEVLLTNIKKYV